MAPLVEVLLVDPDPKGCKALTYALGSEGFQVRVVPIERAMEAFRSRNPQTLVVAIREDLEPGLNLVRQIRVNGQGRRTSVVVLCAPRLAEVVRAIPGVDQLLLSVHPHDVAIVSKMLAWIERRQNGASTLSGSLCQFGLLPLIRAMLALRRSGVIRLERKHRKGELSFVEGEVVSAQIGTLQGSAALNRLLLWPDATFALVFGAVSSRSGIFKKGDELIAELEALLREVTSAIKAVGPLETVMSQGAIPAHTTSDSIPTEVWPTLHLFDGQRTLIDVIEESPFRPFDTLRVIAQLFDLGIIIRKNVPVDSRSARYQPTPDECLGREERAGLEPQRSPQISESTRSNSEPVVGSRQRRPIEKTAELIPVRIVPTTIKVVGDSPSLTMPTTPSRSTQTPARIPIARNSSLSPVTLLYPEKTTSVRQTVQRTPTNAAATAQSAPSTEPTARAVLSLVSLTKNDPVRTKEPIGITRGEVTSVRKMTSIPEVSRGPSVVIAPELVISPVPRVTQRDKKVESGGGAVELSGIREIASPKLAANRKSPAYDSGGSSIQIDPVFMKEVEIPIETSPQTKNPPTQGITHVESSSSHGGFNALERDFFDREADLYNNNEYESFDDLDRTGKPH